MIAIASYLDIAAVHNGPSDSTSVLTGSIPVQQLIADGRYGGELRHVGEEDLNLENVLQRRSRLPQNRDEILEHGCASALDRLSGPWISLRLSEGIPAGLDGDRYVLRQRRNRERLAFVILEEQLPRVEPGRLQRYPVQVPQLGWPQRRQRRRFVDVERRPPMADQGRQLGSGVAAKMPA